MPAPRTDSDILAALLFLTGTNRFLNDSCKLAAAVSEAQANCPSLGVFKFVGCGKGRRSRELDEAFGLLLLARVLKSGVQGMDAVYMDERGRCHVESQILPRFTEKEIVSLRSAARIVRRDLRSDGFARRVWIAYRFAGADRAALKAELVAIRAAFEVAGHTVTTRIEDIQRWGEVPMSKIEAIRQMNMRLPDQDLVVCFYFDANPSSGRSWEAGQMCGMDKPTVMAMREGVKVGEYERAMFEANPANEARRMPPVVIYREYSEVAEAIKV